MAELEFERDRRERISKAEQKKAMSLNPLVVDLSQARTSGAA